MESETTPVATATEKPLAEIREELTEMIREGEEIIFIDEIEHFAGQDISDELARYWHKLLSGERTEQRSQAIEDIGNIFWSGIEGRYEPLRKTTQRLIAQGKISE